MGGPSQLYDLPKRLSLMMQYRDRSENVLWVSGDVLAALYANDSIAGKSFVTSLVHASSA